MAAEVVAFPTPEKEPSRAEKRAGRRKVRVAKRMAETHTPREQLVVAFDHFRATTADYSVDPVKAHTAVATVTQVLLDTADKLAPRRSR